MNAVLQKGQKISPREVTSTVSKKGSKVFKTAVDYQQHHGNFVQLKVNLGKIEYEYLKQVKNQKFRYTIN